MVIGFHNHYCPFEYLNAIREGRSHLRVTEAAGLSKLTSASEILQDLDQLSFF